MIGGQTGALAECAPRTLTIIDRLYQNKKELELRLENINKAIEALESVPQLAVALNAISKAGIY